MRIKIIPSAMGDLADGWEFYDQQGSGLGNYFSDSLFSDIDSLAIYGGIHRQSSGFLCCSLNDFPMPLTINWMRRLPLFGVFWIVAVIHTGSGRN